MSRKIITSIDSFLKRNIARISIFGGVLFILTGILCHAPVGLWIEYYLISLARDCVLARLKLLSSEHLNKCDVVKREPWPFTIFLRELSFIMVILGLILIQKGRELRKETFIKGKMVYFLFFLSLIAFVSCCYTIWFIFTRKVLFIFG
jgi:hypothetical protein